MIQGQGAFFRVSRGNPFSRHAGLEAFIPQFAKDILITDFFPRLRRPIIRRSRAYMSGSRNGGSGLFCTGIPSPRPHGPFVLDCKWTNRALFFFFFFSVFVFYPSLNLYLFFTCSINIYTNFSVTENGSEGSKLQDEAHRSPCCAAGPLHSAPVHLYGRS